MEAHHREVLNAKEFIDSVIDRTKLAAFGRAPRPAQDAPYTRP
jgi:hypothetical protein